MKPGERRSGAEVHLFGTVVERSRAVVEGFGVVVEGSGAEVEGCDPGERYLRAVVKLPRAVVEG